LPQLGKIKIGPLVYAKGLNHQENSAAQCGNSASALEQAPTIFGAFVAGTLPGKRVMSCKETANDHDGKW
jgi:hypothetical protein